MFLRGYMKQFTIIEYSYDLKRSTEVTGTLDELKDRYKSTLVEGSRYIGKAKISVSPKTIKGLLSNLNKAQLNKARIKGLPSKSYSLKQE